MPSASTKAPDDRLVREFRIVADKAAQLLRERDDARAEVVELAERLDASAMALQAAQREVDRLREYATHATSCPRATVREIKYQQPLAERLPCKCGLDRDLTIDREPSTVWNHA